MRRGVRTRDTRRGGGRILPTARDDAREAHALRDRDPHDPHVREPGRQLLEHAAGAAVELAALDRRLRLFSLRRFNLVGFDPRRHGDGSATPGLDAQVRASMLTAFAVGRLQRFARSGFKRLPSEHLEASLAFML